jgi:hypothetical protein
MDHTYWLKQSEKSLFPDILWSRPESKAGAGKLLIVGGNLHGFSAPGNAYNESLEAGAGVVRVVMPDALRKIVKFLLPDADYAPSTPSGSFAKSALDILLSSAQWSDCTLIAGDVGRNSETAMLLESFVKHYAGILVITRDAADYFRESPQAVIDREKTLLVVSLEQLQKMFIHTPTIIPITYSMSSPQLAEALYTYTLEHPVKIMTKHNDLIFVASSGQVSTTKYTEKLWRVTHASRASVFWLQNPDKPFEALTTSIHVDSRQLS